MADALLRRAQARSPHDGAQVVDRKGKVLINNNIIELGAMTDLVPRRLEAARDEIRHCAEFNYVIINQDFAFAVDDLSAIVRASRLRATQQCVRHQALIAQLI